MKLNTTDNRQYEGNLEGETINVGIADVRLIIDRLTDMYSDREMAVVREYSCNALDAHIEAGVTAPIEVSTPGPLAPFLTIRDFGIGLDLDDIRSIYSQYGASTKRNTNTQTGAFGLGCKSGLAYSDQFTVTSTKDGVRIQVVVSRDPSAGITMKVVDTSDTSEPNGTTVMIPARSFNHFEQKAKTFFKHWPKGTVKLNGVEPEHMPGAKWVTDTICINPDRDAQSYVVMGGVPYPVQIDVGLGYYTGITAFVPIGSCEPAPPRESLIDSDGTVETLANVKRDFRNGLQAAILKEIAEADSPAKAATIRLEWSRKVGTQHMPANPTYKGKNVPDSYECDYDTIVAPRYGSKMNAHSSYRKGNHLPLPAVNGAVWVTGFDYVSFTATVKKKLEKWVDDNPALSEYPPNYILTTATTKPDTTWLQDVTFIDWPTIKAIKLPKAQRSVTTGRIPGSYDVYESGDANEDVPADDIDTSNPIFWMVGRLWDGRQQAKWLNKSYPGCTLVMMRSGREDKFQRNFPAAKAAEQVIKDAYAAWVKGIDKDDATAIYMRQNADGRLNHLDASQINDPEIKHVKAIMDRDTSKVDDAAAEWRLLGFYYDPDEDSKIVNPLAKYPLLPESYYFGRYMKAHSDHIYRYMNNEFLHLTQQAAKAKP